jgi:hypothetical protein
MDSCHRPPLLLAEAPMTLWRLGSLIAYLWHSCRTGQMAQDARATSMSTAAVEKKTDVEPCRTHGRASRGRRSQTSRTDPMQLRTVILSRYTVAPVSPMPEPGDPCPGFIADVGRCWQMIYSRQLQATHCHDTPSWTGRWFSPRGDRWWRVCLSRPSRGIVGAEGVRPAAIGEPAHNDTTGLSRQLPIGARLFNDQ